MNPKDTNPKIVILIIVLTVFGIWKFKTPNIHLIYLHAFHHTDSPNAIMAIFCDYV